MTETWATSGADLHLDIDVSGTRVRRQLEDALRGAIQAGRLHPGTRLPSSRSLAADLGIARNTVADAYGLLAAEGWLVAGHGSGTWVAERVHTEPTAPPGRARPGRGAPVQPGERRRRPVDVPAHRMAGGSAASARGRARRGVRLRRPGRPLELRVALADYLARARGVRAAADRIVICSGFTQALGLLSQVLAARRAGTLAVEQYGHQHHRDVIAAHGLAVRPVPVDRRGAVIADLADADAALLTPAHQFPLGVPLAAARRTQAVAWAAATGATIIEDDYDGEFRYDREAIGAMQALAPGSVIYAGTASKTLAPGLRLAWLVLPAHLVADVLAVKVLADRQTGALDQLTLAELIGSGNYDRHVRRCRQAYRRRRERLKEALAEQVPQARLTGVAAGLHAVAELPAGVSEAGAIAAAAARGLAISGLSDFAAPGARHAPALVVGFATPPAHSFTTAVARLCAALRDVAPAAVAASGGTGGYR